MKAYIVLTVILLIMFYLKSSSINNFIGGEELEVGNIAVNTPIQPVQTSSQAVPNIEEPPTAPTPDVAIAEPPPPPPKPQVSIEKYNRKLKEIDMLNNRLKRYDTRIRNLVKINRSMRARARADYLLNKYDTDPKNGMITYREIVNKETGNLKKF